MKKIFWSAFVGSENLGDEAIFESILYNLDVDPSHVTVTSLNEEKTRRLGVDTVPLHNFRSIRAAIQRSEVVVLGGGGIIQDQSSILNLIYFYRIMRIARNHRKPVVWAFVGIGPLQHRLSRLLLRDVSDSVKLAVVRDENSKRELESVLGSSRMIKTTLVANDPVLNYPSKKSKKYTKASNEIVVSLRRWFFVIPILPSSIAKKINARGYFASAYRAFVQRVAAALDDCYKSNPKLSFRFVSFYDTEDLPVIRDVAKAMKSNAPTRIEANMTVASYLECVSCSDLVVGMRFHSLVLAAVAGIPFVAIDYSTKVKFFTKKMRQSKYMVSVEEPAPEKLCQAIQAAHRDGEKNQAIITAKLDTVKTQNREAFEKLGEQLT